MPLSAGDKLGPYEILAPIGKGGMGEVYRARDPRLNRDVAIKVSAAQFSERFEREAKAIAALNHPNICQIYDVGPNYLVMEYIEGEAPRGPYALEEALRIARQIADALEAAHDKGITHRDLKPGNIKIKPDGTVKVLDFGLAKIAAAPASTGENSPTLTIGMTEAGMILGTASYMAPEQARAKEAVDKRADIWAFGVVLHELITGKRLFTGEDVGEILAKVIRDEPDLSGAPPQVRNLLRSCLEKDPRKRLRDIGDAWRLLSRDSDGAESAPLPSRLGSAGGWIAAGVLAVAALGASWIAWSATRPHEKPVVRLDLDLGPDRTVRSLYGPDVVLSPDGARLAYLSRNRLFTRRLDQPLATELAGTEGASGPFFSPDGQWIAFAAGGKLKKVSVTGSAAVTLCDATLLLGGSWGEDGYIVATLNLSAGLSRVPAEGGAAVPLTQLDLGRRERTHRWPQILPGGKTVVFTSSANLVGGYDAATIEAVSLADGRRKTLVQGGSFGRYLATQKGSGHLIYANRGTLFAVPFDPAALEVRGPTLPILEQVAYSTLTGVAKLDASPSGILIYENGEFSAALVTLQWLEEGGKTRPLLAKPGNYGRPSLSPDGRRLALEVIDESTQDIWGYDLERDTMTRLTFDGKGNESPIWTPDGRSIVFQGPQGLSWTRADGGGQPQSLLRTKGTAFPWSFTPDGKRLSYMETTSTGYDLFSVPLEGGSAALQAGKPEVLLQTPFDERYPAFSPDGRWVAYVSNESGNYEIYVRAFPEAASGGGKWQISSGGGTYPMWSRTGHQLFFEALDNRVMAAGYTVQGSSFVAEKPRVWSERQLSNLTNTSRNLDFAPDGKRFAVVMPVEQPASSSVRSRVTLIENFFDELRRRVPTGK
jgi:Tol biopolymer transport system component/predicted Ser/Thr protein kinase